MSEEKKKEAVDFSVMNVYQRLNYVRDKVKYIQKKKSVEGYKAVEHDEVTAVIREHLVKAGIFVIPHCIDSTTTPTGTQTKNGTPIIRYEGKYRVDFINMDKPDDVLSVANIEAHANDHGDKAPGKAISYATKTAELKVLTLETGESDESRYQSEVEVISEEQLMDITALLDEVGEEGKKALLSWAKIDNVAELPAVKFKMAIAALEKRRDSANDSR